MPATMSGDDEPSRQSLMEAADKRKVQNRIAQRKHRKSLANALASDGYKEG